MRGRAAPIGLLAAALLGLAQPPASPRGEGLTRPRLLVAERDAFTGLPVLRDGWGPDSTWIAFSSGAYFAKHDHLDTNHFAIYRKGQLALDSGADYTDTESPHYLNYYRRTVAPGFEFWTPGDERGGTWGSGQNWPLDPPEGGPLPDDPYLKKMWKTFWGEDLAKLQPSNRRAVVPGAWRLEVSPAVAARDDVFLNVLEIGNRGAEPVDIATVQGHDLAGALVAGEAAVLFTTTPARDFAEGEATLPDQATASTTCSSRPASPRARRRGACRQGPTTRACCRRPGAARTAGSVCVVSATKEGAR